MARSVEPPVLQLTNLTTVFPLKRGVVRAVTNVNLTLGQGEILGLVGESGCGKSATMLSILQRLPFPGRIVAGLVLRRRCRRISLKTGQISRKTTYGITSLSPEQASSPDSTP